MTDPNNQAQSGKAHEPLSKASAQSGKASGKYGDRNASYDDDNWGQAVSKDQAEALNAEQRQVAGRMINWVRLLQWLVFVVMGGAFVGYYQALKEQVLGPWSGPCGVVAWYALATTAGALSLLIPLMVYAAIARRHSTSALHTMFDLLRAEFLKYGLMILCLGVIFKLTSLPPALVILGFVVMMVAQLINSILAVVHR